MGLIMEESCPSAFVSYARNSPRCCCRRCCSPCTRLPPVAAAVAMAAAAGAIGTRRRAKAGAGGAGRSRSEAAAAVAGPAAGSRKEALGAPGFGLSLLYQPVCYVDAGVRVWIKCERIDRTRAASCAVEMAGASTCPAPAPAPLQQRIQSPSHRVGYGGVSANQRSSTQPCIPWIDQRRSHVDVTLLLTTRWHAGAGEAGQGQIWPP